MNNKGRVTVFLCLMVMVMIPLFTAAYRAVQLYAAKEKAVCAARTAISGLKADYNSYIYEHYHILLFDKNCGGAGEAGLEARLLKEYEENLGAAFSECDVKFNDFRMIYDDDCEPFKEQMSDYMKYAAVEKGVDMIMEKTGGSDGTVPQELLDDIDEVKNKEAEEEGGEEDDDSEEATENGDENGEEVKVKKVSIFKVKDPRKFTKKLKTKGLLGIILPEGTELSEEEIETEGLPSRTLTVSSITEIFDHSNEERKFKDIDRFEDRLKESGGWTEGLYDAGVSMAYARCCFNSLTNGDRNDSTELKYELEYLVAGKKSDYENIKSVINSLVWLRTPVCYAYLVRDAEKMAVVTSIAAPLSFLVFLPEPVLKFLLAGCWSYAEAMADVRTLAAGKKIAFVKTRENWVTDIKKLADTVTGDVPEAEHGLSYEDHLCMLMALKTDRINYRMLDLMQLNAAKEGESIKIADCAVAAGADFTSGYMGRKFYYHMVTEY